MIYWSLENWAETRVAGNSKSGALIWNYINWASVFWNNIYLNNHDTPNITHENVVLGQVEQYITVSLEIFPRLFLLWPFAQAFFNGWASDERKFSFFFSLSARRLPQVHQKETSILCIVRVVKFIIQSKRTLYPFLCRRDGDLSFFDS